VNVKTPYIRVTPYTSIRPVELLNDWVLREGNFDPVSFYKKILSVS